MNDNQRVGNGSDMILIQGQASAAGSPLRLTVQNNADFTNNTYIGFSSNRPGVGAVNAAGFHVNWNGPLNAQFLNNSWVLNNALGFETGLLVEGTRTADFSSLVFNTSTVTNRAGTSPVNDIGLHGDFIGQAQVFIQNNNNPTNAAVAAFSLTNRNLGILAPVSNETAIELWFHYTAAQNTATITNNTIEVADDSTGMLFTPVAAPSSFSIGGNTIGLDNLLPNIGPGETGIWFQNTSGAITLSSTANNTIFSNPNTDNFTQFFIPPTLNNGRLLINNTLVP